MQRFGLIYSQNWYISLPMWQKELVRTSLELYSREERMKSAFSDYSFVIFPMAKAYEGFLKTFLYNIGLINRDTYLDKRFRIGSALNPDIHPDRRGNTWLYDDLARMCGSQFARYIWDTWLSCRNQTFHYYPDNQKPMTLAEAAQKIEMMAMSMEQTLACELKK